VSTASRGDPSDEVVVDLPVDVEELVIERRTIERRVVTHDFAPRSLRIPLHEERATISANDANESTDDRAHDGAAADALEEIDEPITDDARSR
jgi:stress response protein YsnF